MEKHGTVHLAAGRVPFRVDYFQGGAAFGLSVAWGGPGFAAPPALHLGELRPGRACQRCATRNCRSCLAPDKLTAATTQLVKEKAELDKQEVPTEKVLCVTEAGPKAPDMFVLLRGNPTTPGDKVEPGFPLCAGGGRGRDSRAAARTRRRPADGWRWRTGSPRRTIR